MSHTRWLNCVILLSAAIPVKAQTAPDASDPARILERLDRLEAENRRLSEEIADLKSELARRHEPAATAVAGDPPGPQAVSPGDEAASAAAADSAPPGEADLPERMAVQESRTAELDQKKVESSQKMPVQLTGMLLFNAFGNGEYAGSSLNDPVIAAASGGQRLDGATFRQTVLGLRFFGPQIPGGGTVSGSVYMDFFGGGIQPGNNLFRLRLATIDLAWKNTTFTVGQDKPIIAPREPTSLAQVGVSPLTAAGNLWQWQPQARIEQRFHLGEESEIRVQAGVFESDEPANAVSGEYSSTLGVWRPAYEARVQYGYSRGGFKFEIAPGYHESSSRVAGQSVPSRAVSLDWLVRPSSRVDFTGAWFNGTDLAGLGSLRQGFTILPSGAPIGVHSDGGWGQMTVNATSRLSLHIFGGVENDRGADLAGDAITRNFEYGGNVMWKLAPNVIAAFESTQLRTSYLISGTRLNNHYDLALGYLF